MLDNKGFDKWAGSYDESINPNLTSFPFDGYYDVLASVLSMVKTQKNHLIMDVGIGTGLLSEELYKIGCTIFGVDFSDKMLEQAKLKIPDGLFETVDVSKDHFGKFNDYQFDRVISSYFFHHLNQEQKITFIKKTLKNNLSPDGKIIIADIGFKNEEDFESSRIKYQDQWDNDEFYLIGESIISQLLNEKIVADYKQVSSCAGILVCIG